MITSINEFKQSLNESTIDPAMKADVDMIFKEVVTAMKGVSSNINPISSHLWERGGSYVLSKQSGNWGKDAQDNYTWDDNPEEYEDAWGWVVGALDYHEGWPGADMWEADIASIREINKKYPEYKIEIEGYKDTLYLSILKNEQR